MKKMTKYLSKCLVLLIILTPVLSWSQEQQLAIGQINQISSNYIIVRDIGFKMLPTVKVFLNNKKPGKLKDAKKGDFVRLSLLKINKVKYVDSITILPAPRGN